MNQICYGVLFIFWCDAAEPPPPPVVVCPPPPAWSAEYQERLSQEFAALPPKTAIGEALRQHLRLREQLRRCRKINEK